MQADEAVVYSLRWLSEKQNNNGNWGQTNTTTTTCFALRAYFERGEFETSKLFGDVVGKGIEYLVQNRNSSKSTLEYSLVAGIMSDYYCARKNKEAKDIASDYISIIINSQNSIGGWSEITNNSKENDILLDCWAIYALKSCLMSNINEQNETIKDCLEKSRNVIVANVDTKTGMFGRFNSKNTTIELTAAGVYALQLLGDIRSPEYKRGLKLCIENADFTWQEYMSPPVLETLFCNYFFRQLIVNNEDARNSMNWWDWYAKVNETLIEHQVINDTNKQGYWYKDKKQVGDEILTSFSAILLGYFYINTAPDKFLYEPNPVDDEITVEIDID